MNHSETAANAGVESLHEAHYGSPAELKMRAFIQPGHMQVMRDQKSQSQAMACNYLNTDYNHFSY